MRQWWWLYWNWSKDECSEVEEYHNSRIWRQMKSDQRRLGVDQKIKPRLWAEWVVFSEELCILASCLLSPVRRNSVLEVLRVKRFAVIQEEICWRAFWMRVMLKPVRWVKGESWVPSAWRWWLRDREEMRVLAEVVYMIKSKAPRTERDDKSLRIGWNRPEVKRG